MPILPPTPEGYIPFSYPALEGFLYAMAIAPFEIDLGTWGAHLEVYLPMEDLETTDHITDITNIYFEIEDNVHKQRYFQTYTFSFPETSCADPFQQHPVWHWVQGFQTGMELVLNEIKQLPKKKRSTKAFQQARKEYETFSLQLLLLLRIKLDPEDLSKAGANPQGLEELHMDGSLKELFLFVLENLDHAGYLASGNLYEA